MTDYQVGDLRRSIWRTSDITQALAAYVYAVTAAGGAVDMGAIGYMCLSFGIEVGDVAQRVRLMSELVGEGSSLPRRS
jgi:hypothetical protein